MTQITFDYVPVAQAPEPAQPKPVPAVYHTYPVSGCPGVVYSLPYAYHAQYVHPVVAQPVAQTTGTYYPAAFAYHPVTAAAPAQPAVGAPAHNVWYGRTQEQVDEDDHKTALKNGVYRENEMAPYDPKPDQLFWVIELDGSRTLRDYDTIDTELKPGKWYTDPTWGNAYFVCSKG